MIVFRGYSHISIAIALFLVIKDYISLDRPIGIVVFTIIIGSILADLDHPSSLFGRLIVPVSAIIKHRSGITHSFFGAFLFTLPILFYDITYFIAAITGYILHLLLDTLTTTGVKWLYPYNKKSYSLKVARTGGPEEALMFALSLLYIFKKKF